MDNQIEHILRAPEAAFALDTVRLASRLVKHIQAQTVTPALTKTDHSPVTVADFASQALVGHQLKKAFPQDPLVGEEGSAALQNSEERPTLEQVTAFVAQFLPEATPHMVCDWIDHGSADPARRFWTIDPIDGTKGFLRGDQYVVALALLIDNQVQIGVLGCPQLSLQQLADMQANDRSSDARLWGLHGTLVIAVRDKGTWVTPLDGSEHFVGLRVSACTQPDQARILGSYEAEHTNQGQVNEFARRLGVKTHPLRLDSQAKYALLAGGQGELLLRLLSPAKPDYREKIWDQAAGSLIIQEAGGKVTDLDGSPLDFSTGRTLKHNRGVLASNGTLHERALETLRSLYKT